MNRQLAQRLAVESHFLLRQLIDKDGVADALHLQRSADACDPECAEAALLELAGDVGVGAGADHRFVRLHEGRAAHAAVALRESADLLVSAMPDDASFNAHGSEGGDQGLEGSDVRGVSDNRAIETLLALALLLEQVTAAAAFERVLTAPCSPDTFLRAAVGLHFWHRDTEL